MRAPQSSAASEFSIHREATPDFGTAVQAAIAPPDELSDLDIDIELDSSPVVLDEATVVDAEVAFAEVGGELETVNLDAPFDGWLLTLQSVIAEAGVSIRLDALAALIVRGRVERSLLPVGAEGALYEGKIGTALGDDFVTFESFLEVSSIWQDIISGNGGDMGQCGGRTFDDWSADLAARLMGSPGKTESLKRQLRGRGVAAFGFVHSAA